MSVWARNEKNRLVRTVSPINPEESIVSQVSQDNFLPQWIILRISKDSMSLHSMEVMLHFQ